MTILELSEQLRDGRLTCTALTKACLRAIADNDQGGRKLNSVAELDPDVLFNARAIDEELRENGPKSPLHGIPLLIKDNIDVRGLHTTAGSLALADLIASEDAPLIKKLRDAGALILGEPLYWYHYICGVLILGGVIGLTLAPAEAANSGKSLQDDLDR